MKFQLIYIKTVLLMLIAVLLSGCVPSPEPLPPNLPCEPDYEAFTRRLECNQIYPGHSFSMSIEGDKRVILANNVPEHPIGFEGVLPTAPDPFRYEMKVEAVGDLPSNQPTVSYDGYKWIFGIALNGVEFDFTWENPWINHCTGEPNWNFFIYPGIARSDLDCSGGVLWSGNRYRYKSFPHSYIESFGADGSEMVLIGYAADGWPIYYKYAYQDAMDPTSPIVAFSAGSKLRDGDRDEVNCHVCGPITGKYWGDYTYETGPQNLGLKLYREGVTPEYPAGTWYYLMTDDFPHLNFYIEGGADPSFRKE